MRRASARPSLASKSVASLPSVTSRLIQTLDRLQKPTVIQISAFTMILIGWLDGLTSWETSLFIFYAGPISLIAWRIGRNPGILLGLLSGAVWFVANWNTHPYQSLFAYTWASFNRTLYFVFVALGVAAFRSLREESQAKLDAVLTARNLERQVTFSGEREQMRIGRDLHDGVCQSLAAIDCAAEYLRLELEKDALPQTRIADSIQKMVRKTMKEARSLARGLFPVKLDQQGLESALEEVTGSMSQLHGVPVQLKVEGDLAAIPSEKAIHVYRIAQEALSNSLRHAAPSIVQVELTQTGSTAYDLKVCDDGSGFEPSETLSEGVGLQSIRHRSQILNGNLALTRLGGGGTELKCSFQL